MSAQLMPQQEQALEIAKRHDRWGFFYDTGTGKTLIGLHILRWNISNGLKCLVVAPKMLLYDAWMRDCETFMPSMCQSLHIYKPGKETRDVPILLINYEALRAHQEVFNWGWDVLVLDESQAIKNPSSQTSKTFVKKASLFKKVYLFSATPAPNSELEYYSQLRMLIPGMDKSFYKWREKWFVKQDKFGWKWKLRGSSKEEFYKVLRGVASFIKKEDVLSLKGMFYRFIDFELGTDEYAIYKKMLIDSLLEIREKEIPATTAGAKLMKLRQIISGFVLTDDGPQEIGNSKLTAFVEFANRQAGKLLVWVQYVHEAEQIKGALGDKVAAITGETSQKAREKILAEFRSDTGPQILVANPKTIGKGTTFVNVDKAVFYSLSYSYEELKQAQDRIYRKGQDKPVYIYFLLAKQHLIDSVIFDAIETKRAKADQIVKAVMEDRRWKV